MNILTGKAKELENVKNAATEGKERTMGGAGRAQGAALRCTTV